MILMEFVDESFDAENEFRFNDDGTYNFFNHTGEYYFGGDTLTLESNKQMHIFKIKWADEEHYHFTGRRMVKTTSILTADRSLKFACMDDSSSWNPDDDYEVTYYIDPIMVPWDIDTYCLRRKIISLREHLRMDTSKNTVEYFANMNLERGLQNTGILIVDHTAAGNWIVHYDRQCHILVFYNEKTNQRYCRQFYTHGVESGVPQMYVSGYSVYVPEELQKIFDMMSKKTNKNGSSLLLWQDFAQGLFSQGFHPF